MATSTPVRVRTYVGGELDDADVHLVLADGQCVDDLVRELLEPLPVVLVDRLGRVKNEHDVGRRTVATDQTDGHTCVQIKVLGVVLGTGYISIRVGHGAGMITTGSST